MASNINPHRKVATYGRVSRKANYNFKYFATHVASEQPLYTILAKNNDLIQEDGHVPARIQAQPSDAFEVQNSGMRTTRSTRSTIRPSRKVDLESKHLASEEKPSFDMLSPECEGLRRCDPNRKMSGQEGNMEYNPEAEADDTVYDDQSMSQVSAFGAISQHKTNLKKKKRLSSEVIRNGQQDQNLYSSSAISPLWEPDTKSSEPAKIVSSELQVRRRQLAVEENHQQKGADLDVSLHQMRCSGGNGSLTEIGSTNTVHTNPKAFPPSCPYSIGTSSLATGGENSKNISFPQGLAQFHAASTTHQRELWDMLLRGDAGRQSYLSPKLLSVTSALKDDISNSRSGNQWERGSQEASYNHVRKRRRLVDHLNPCETDKYENGTALINQDNIFKGSGGDTISDTSSAVAKPSSCESHPLITSSQDHLHNAEGLGKLSMPIQDGRLKVTYARQRSFVNDEAQGALVDAATSNDPPQLQAAWEKTESDIQIKPDVSSEEVVNSQGTMMRSIYELRKAGSNARAIRNTEALLDDIRGETSLPREHKVSRLLQLIVRLQDIPFCELFIEQGLDSRLLSCLDLDDDMALKALVAAAILHLLVPSTYVSKLRQTGDPRLSKLLLELLDQECNLKSLVKNIGLIKPGTEHANFEKSWEILLKSAAWGKLRPLVVTARVIGLRCLEYIARHTYDSGKPTASIPPSVFWKVAQILDPKFSISLKNPDPKTQLDLQLALSVLEIYTIGKSSMIEESIWKGETISYLKSFLPRLSTWREDEIGKLRTLTLRLYLNLMNNRPNLCEAFATTDIVDALLVIIVSHFRRLAQDNCDDTGFLLDDLILALGSMINLAEWCRTAPQLVMSLHYEDSSFLDVLLMLYTSKQLEAQEVFSEKEAAINVAFGYLSVLISYLCVDGMIREKVCSSLHGKTLKQLLDSVEEFMHYHTQIDENPQGGLNIDDKANFLHRLHSVISDLRMIRSP